MTGETVPLFHLLILAVVQGITEFLPISSSGHLVLTWDLLEQLGDSTTWSRDDERLDLDIAVHLGTLLAVCLYFHKDLLAMLGGTLKIFTGKITPGLQLVLLLFIATVPVLIAGFLLKQYGQGFLRSLTIVAWANIFFALLLWGADRFGLMIRRIEHMRWSEALLIGLMQVLALIPGTSRSGVTMTAARIFGYERQEAARFSMLMSIPTILGASLLTILDLRDSGNMALGQDMLLAAAFAFATALVAIALLMRWLKEASFTPFVYYRLALGALLLWMIYA
ncbi:undecaprenyl-diphosphate phosphatase [Rhodovibrionaceae bacterium A322]